MNISLLFIRLREKCSNAHSGVTIISELIRITVEVAIFDLIGDAADAALSHASFSYIFALDAATSNRVKRLAIPRPVDLHVCLADVVAISWAFLGGGAVGESSSS